uniref:Uncharacterized protein n=1 Tax=Arundo donax TaxID=35708 RepID=A0A0A9CLL1_ARUDO
MCNILLSSLNHPCERKEASSSQP